jgi:hypothetical protein
MSIEKLETIANELNAAHQKIRDFAMNEGKKAIGDAFAICFALAPQVTKIVWTQYTPYFNDGESCEFGVGDPSVFVESDDQDGSHYDHNIQRYLSDKDKWLTADKREEYNKKLDERYGRAFVESFWKVWSALPDELLEAVFGDHVMITVTRDEVAVELYNHD